MKEFIIKNKVLILTTCALIIAACMVALGIHMSNDNIGTKEPVETTKNNANQNIESSENSDFSSEETKSSTEESQSSSETSETTETTTEEETTEEETTKEYIPVTYNYLIKINRAANCVTVYKKDENGQFTVPHKAMTVSCGLELDSTPLGTYKTINNYKWRLLFGNVYGQYSYRIVGSTLFHSVPYYTASNDTLKWQEYNKLGSPASQGCIRMTVIDAKWLMDNCPIGTTVIIYDDKNNPGPLGKPETIKIPENSPHKGWDPTDPDPNNPWHKYGASITYPKSKSITVKKGSDALEVLKHFKAKDTCGNDISNKIVLSKNLDLNKAGIYDNIIVSVTDAIGSYVEVIVKVVVEEEETTTIPIVTEPSSETETTTDETTDETTTQNEETQTSETETSETESSSNDGNIFLEEVTN
ncbi:MAG: L,D-transpeptidase [Lachnospiraceae bacterium]|nr:L,D-transpeptidase [Lachnospiraceae bacterium]